MVNRRPSTDVKQRDRKTTQPRKRKRAASALDLSALTLLMGVHMRLANVALYHDFIDAVGDLDITQRQSAVLILIATNRGASQVALAEFLGINRATMISMIDRLEARGLVERRSMDGDRRLRGIFLTSKGRETYAELRKRISQHERRMFKDFSSRELKQFTEYLSRVHGKL